MTLTSKQLFPRSAFVGFDTLFDEIDRITKHSGDAFPPHNILHTDDNRYLIELAVAGFAESELDIEVKDRTLTVRGKHEDRGREYVHKGISTKKFERKFRLSEFVEVTGAEYLNGLLAIELEVQIPDTKLPRKIEIKRSSGPQILNEETNENFLR